MSHHDLYICTDDGVAIPHTGNTTHAMASAISDAAVAIDQARRAQYDKPEAEDYYPEVAVARGRYIALVWNAVHPAGHGPEEITALDAYANVIHDALLAAAAAGMDTEAIIATAREWASTDYDEEVDA